MFDTSLFQLPSVHARHAHGQVKHLYDGSIDGTVVLLHIAQHNVVGANAALLVGWARKEGRYWRTGKGTVKFNGIAHGIDIGIGGLQERIHTDTTSGAHFQPGGYSQPA